MATILVVDDRAINRQLLVTLLGYGGHRLLEASDGAEALGIVHAERPELVITDILMPTMDGLEFAQRLRADPAIAHTAIIFYTATFRLREAQALARSCGVSHIIPKPADPALILKTVHATLGLSAPEMPAAIAPTDETGGVALGARLAGSLEDAEALNRQMAAAIGQDAAPSAERDRLRRLADKLFASLSDMQAVGLRLATMHELGLELAVEREPLRLLVVFCRAARNILSAKYAGVGVLDGDGQHVRHFVARGYEVETEARLSESMASVGMLGLLATEPRPCRLRDLGGDAQRAGLPAAHPPIDSFLAVPIASPARVYGWLYLAGKLGAEEFSQDDERVAAALAAQVALAYENVSLYEEIQRQAAQLQHEVSERKQAEESLKRTTAELRLLNDLVEQSTQPFAVADLQAQLVRFNRAYVQLTGYTADELRGMPYMQLIPERWHELANQQISELLATGQTVRLELELLRKGGAQIPVEVVVDIYRNAAGEPEYLCAFTTDITERQRAEEARHQSEKRYRALIEHSADAIALLDANGLTVYASPAITGVLGYAVEEYVGRSGLEFVHPDDLPAAARTLAQLAQQPNASAAVLVRQRHKDGSWRWLEGVATNLLAEPGVQAVVANFHDVTERRLAEQRLYLQSAAMEAAANAIVIADRDGRITWVNPAFTQLTGYALEEVQGQNPRFLKSGQQDQAFYKKLWETVLAGQVWHGEIVNRRKDGRLYTEEMTITPVADEGGSIAYFVAIKQDITERKRAEAALRAAQERLQHVTASSPAVIYALKIDDSAFLPSWVSENITDLLGYEAPEALAPGWWIDHVHPDDQARVLSEQSRPFPGDRLLREYRMRHKDGAHRWIRDEARLLRDAAGQPVEAIGSWSDISERKRAEEALESVSSQLKTLFDNLDEVFFSLDAVHWKVILVSPACEKVYGRPQQAFLDNPVLWQEVVHPEDRARMEAGQAVLFAGKPFYNEYRIVRPDGEIRWVESRVKPSQDATGKVIRLDGVVSDVTERKRADEALRQSEVRFRALIENAPDAIALLGMDGKLQYASPSTRHILGYAPEDVVGADPAAFIHPDDLPGLLTQLNDLIQKPGHVVVTQYRFRHLDGSWRWLESAISNLLAEPSVNAIVFNYRDITEHKQVEDQIRKLSRAVEQASSIVMITNLRGTIEYVNPKFTQITGYMPEEVIGTDTHRLGEMASRDGERMQSALSASGEWRGEFFNIKKNGERFWEAASISVIRDDHGDVTHYLKVAEDVTERKRVDESLQQTTAELRFLNDLVEQATQPFAAADLDGRFIRFNHALAQLTGYSGDELRGMTFRQLTAEDRQEHESQQLARLMATGQAVRYESECQRKDGSRVPVEMVVDLYRNAAGEPEYFYAFITDITERKRAEETLRYQLEIDELVATISTNFIYFTLDEIDTGIDRALESVGAFVDVDGGDVFHFNDDGARLDNLHAWRAAGPAPGADRRPPIPVDSLAWCRERLNRFEVIHVSRAEDLPHEARALLASLDGAGAKSLMIVPLAFGKVLVGFLIFISVRREKTWSDDDVRLVKLIGEIFVNALVRKQARAALEQERALLAQRVAERTADLSAANAALARAARLKDEFLASMSHELRTPLNAILGLSEALQEQVYGLLNADQLKTLRTIEDSGRHLLDLINDILDLSKVEAGKLELQVGPVEIETVCQASLRLIREAANKKRLKVHSVFDSTLTTIHADERRLTQILVNLLSNAVKFTPEGGSIGLEVADESERSVVRFTVWDTGIGISEGDIRQLFQPFVQLDSSLARQQSGTGLGLSLTQRMVEMHGGSVRVESEVDRGSRFSIYLPSQLPEVAASPLGAAQPKASSAPPIPGIRRAFVVEDSPMAADQLARYLAELGVETIAHTTAADVVERVRASQPDVILLDILLPDPAGWDALAQLKADVRTRDIPVVITSVVDDPARGRALGAAEYLVKPISRQQLRAALNRARPEAERTAPTAPAGTAARETVVQPLILLAEDNANNIQTLSDYLQAKRYRVIVARNGSEAIERAAEEMPNLILMDMQMPGMDGLEATRRIRADADLRHIPIIALTALAMPGDRERCLEAGANEYLSKPISLKQLVGAMEAQLHRDSTERGGAA